VNEQEETETEPVENAEVKPVASDDCEETDATPSKTEEKPVATGDCDDEIEAAADTTASATPSKQASSSNDDCDEEPKAEAKPVATSDCDDEIEAAADSSSETGQKPTASATPSKQASSSSDDCDEEPEAEAKPVATGDCDEGETFEAAADSSSSSGSTAQMYGQCGGKNWTGATTCPSGTSCKKMNDYYSQCIGSNSRVRRYVQ
jgi:hypothetical protein